MKNVPALAWISALALLAACSDESGGGSISGSGANDGSNMASNDGGGMNDPATPMGMEPMGGNGNGGNAMPPVVGPSTVIGPAFEYTDPGAAGAFKDPGLSDGVETQFGGSETASGAPTLVYPLAHSMHPNNLGNITFQWSRGAATNTVFRIEIDAAGDLYRFYIPCNASECAYQLPSNEWLTLGRDYAGSAFEVTVAGTDGNGGEVTVGSATSLSFSPEAVLGALYYWAAKNKNLKRATFGADLAVPFISPGSETEFECVACHSVSRDGKVIAFAVTQEGGEDIAAIQTAPTADPLAPYVEPTLGTSPYAGAGAGPEDFLGHNVALSPDGSMAAVNGVPADEDNWPPFFELRDTESGDTIMKWELYDPLFGGTKLPILPEWSPDGSKIVVSLADSTGDTTDFGCVWTSDTCRASIAVLPVLNGTVGEPEILVPNDGDDYHFYPTWSPDGEWIAFASGTWDANNPSQKSLGNPNALLRLVRSTGGPYTCPGPDCYELTNGMQYSPSEAAAGMGRHSTWPKFTPFAQGDNGDVMFISFNSRIDYGFLSTGQTQLWMFAIDVSQVAGGDPSFTPIWLPYQDLDDGGLTPYWTQQLPCETDPEGGCSGCVGGEQCVVTEGNQCQCLALVI